MKLLALKGQGGRVSNMAAELVTSVEALNHDNTVRCAMHLYKTAEGYLCQRIDRPDTIDVRYRLEVCDNMLTVYQFFGTEPLANYLYGVAGLTVPGLRKQLKQT